VLKKQGKRNKTNTTSAWQTELKKEGDNPQTVLLKKYVVQTIGPETLLNILSPLYY
jgi:hypothetical protein